MTTSEGGTCGIHQASTRSSMAISVPTIVTTETTYAARTTKPVRWPRNASAYDAKPPGVGWAAVMSDRQRINNSAISAAAA